MKTYRFAVARAETCGTCHRRKADIVLTTSEHMEKHAVIHGQEEFLCMTCVATYYPDEVYDRAKDMHDSELAKHAPVALTHAPGVTSTCDEKTIQTNRSYGQRPPAVHNSRPIGTR